MTQRFRGDDADDRRIGLHAAGVTIRSGGLVVLPTDTAYAVACDAFNATATAALRTAKGRPPGSPLPVLIGAPGVADGIVYNLSESARALIRAFWPGGLTLIGRQQPSLSWNLDPDLAKVSVRMPLHPLALELLRNTGPLAATGANYLGSPVPLSAAEAEAQLGESVAVYLDGGPVLDEASSTIVDVTGEHPQIVRTGAVSSAAILSVCPDAWGAGVAADTDAGVAAAGRTDIDQAGGP
ncbi:MAG: L-threonylcarbamoyladenylate synthase [Actinomycetota bacterium]|nr:L-threonylcarbamoyladenylate synthase [Actinomycetota bacterium]